MKKIASIALSIIMLLLCTFPSMTASASGYLSVSMSAPKSVDAGSDNILVLQIDSVPALASGKAITLISMKFSFDADLVSFPKSEGMEIVPVASDFGNMDSIIRTYGNTVEITYMDWSFGAAASISKGMTVSLGFSVNDNAASGERIDFTFVSAEYSVGNDLDIPISGFTESLSVYVGASQGHETSGTEINGSFRVSASTEDAFACSDTGNVSFTITEVPAISGDSISSFSFKFKVPRKLSPQLTEGNSVKLAANDFSGIECFAVLADNIVSVSFNDFSFGSFSFVNGQKITVCFNVSPDAIPGQLEEIEVFDVSFTLGSRMLEPIAGYGNNCSVTFFPDFSSWTESKDNEKVMNYKVSVSDSIVTEVVYQGALTDNIKIYHRIPYGKNNVVPSNGYTCCFEINEEASRMLGENGIEVYPFNAKKPYEVSYVSAGNNVYIKLSFAKSFINFIGSLETIISSGSFYSGSCTSPKTNWQSKGSYNIYAYLSEGLSIMSDGAVTKRTGYTSVAKCATPASFVCNMGKATAVNGVTVRLYKESANELPQSYSVYSSNDGVNFTLLSTASVTSRECIVKFAKTQTQYIRIDCTFSSAYLDYVSFTPMLFNDITSFLPEGHSVFTKNGERFVGGFCAGSSYLCYGNEGLSVIDAEGNKVVGGLAATGSSLAVFYDGIVADSAKIVMKGDVFGDGLLNVTDYIVCRLYLMESYSFDTSSALAADVNGDGIITANDYILLRLAILDAESFYYNG